MAKPVYRLRDDEAGVSEVIGTLLILSMTVVLFAVIIFWVSSIPAPPATTKLDMDASYVPILPNGSGANVTIRHRGGEDLFAVDARIYVTIERAGIPTTTILKTRGVYAAGPLVGKPYGLVDGIDSTWNIGERWQWSNYSAFPTDVITATVVDISRNSVLWSAQVLGAPGTHPPIFLDKWADRLWTTPTADVPYSGTPFRVFARLSDADDDLVSVNATLTVFFGSPDSCRIEQAMYDDGTTGDLTAGDNIWTLYRTCMDSPSLSWDGSIVLFNATDARGHWTTSRMTLHVVPNPSGGTPPGSGESGRPPNLRYNGQQGYNLFNGTEWNQLEFNARPVRDFKENDQVVVVVGSLLLADSRGTNQFVLTDSYSGIPAAPVVYGTTKAVGPTSRPSNNQAFAFYKFVNGWNVFVYKFDLNNASTVGTNFYMNPSHPPYYYFGNYPLSMTIVDSEGAQFIASDAINVTDTLGNRRIFPVITTFKDPAFTLKSTAFNSTDTVYVQVSMRDVDASASGVRMGNVILRDFIGGTQVFKAPISGNLANPPICPVSGECPGNPFRNIFSIAGDPTFAYRFSINLSRADQDGWVDGLQSYSLTISSITDITSTEQYSNLAASIVVVAPLYKMDIVIGNVDTVNAAWGTHDFGYVYTAVNGIDRWRKDRLLSGTKQNPDAYMKAVRFLDYDQDADLDVAASLVNWNGNNQDYVFLFRSDLDNFGNPVYTRFQIGTVSSIVCNDIATGDFTADGLPEILCGGSDGKVWYFRNDGAWTRVDVDTTRTSSVNAVEVGDFDGDGDIDIAVGRSNGEVTYYLNLDGLGNFANIAAVDDWFATTDYTVTGVITENTYLATSVSDNIRESITEEVVNEAVETGATTNEGFDAGSTNWTYADWEQPLNVDGRHQSSGGNPGGYVEVRMNSVSGVQVSGYWYQAFEVRGAGPWTVTVNLDYRVLQKGNLASSITMYAFVDRTPGAPTIGSQVWSTTLTGTGSWTSTGPVNAGNRITGPGVYYLKIVGRTLNFGGSPSTATIVGFDNVQLAWTSTAGPVSELKHYWRVQQLPNRPSSTYTLFVEARRSASTDGDSFSFGWAFGTVSAPPADAFFIDVIDVTQSEDTPFSASLPGNSGGKIVWIRVLDRNRVAGNTSLDTISVDRLYIHVVTSGGPTGSPIPMPDSPRSVTAIDADDQQGDGYWDVVAGTEGGHIYKLLGSPGGLLSPVGAYCGQGTTCLASATAISGVKWVNGTLTRPGLEIALTYGSVGYVITGTGLTGTQISAALPSTGSQTILSLAAGDVDGDGDDELILAAGQTTTGSLRYWRNLGSAISWAEIDVEVNIGAPILATDLGDMSNSAYVGR